MKLLFSTAIAVMIFASCNEGETNASGQTTDSTADMSSVRSTIDATNEKMSAAFASGDSAAAAALYHRDTKIFPPNMEPVTSPEGLGAMIKGFPQWGITGVQIKSSEVYEGKDVMTEVGTFEFKHSAGKVADKGNYMVIWKKDGETWKVLRDIWNSSNPVMGH